MTVIGGLGGCNGAVVLWCFGGVFCFSVACFCWWCVQSFLSNFAALPAAAGFPLSANRRCLPRLGGAVN